MSDLSRRQGALAQRVRRLADQDTVENLQRIYGFYIDKGLWSEAAALFTDDAEFEVRDAECSAAVTASWNTCGRWDPRACSRAGCTTTCSCSP